METKQLASGEIEQLCRMLSMLLFIITCFPLQFSAPLRFFNTILKSAKCSFIVSQYICNNLA